LERRRQRRRNKRKRRRRRRGKDEQIRRYKGVKSRCDSLRFDKISILSVLEIDHSDGQKKYGTKKQRKLDIPE
jgi:hypothetical protein